MNPQTCIISEPNQMQSLGSAIRDLLKTGKVAVQIKPYDENRRTAQNRLLWMWHSELSKHIETHQGQIFDSYDIHEFVVNKLLPKRVIGIDDDPIIARTPTSKLSVKLFSDFLSRYEMFVAETYQCQFTRPDDLYWQALMRDTE